MKVAVIGLGSMGLGAAVSLHKVGFQTLGVDLNTDAQKRFQSYGGVCTTLDQLSGLDAVLIYVVNAQQVEALYDAGLLEHLNERGVVINCVTLEPAKAIEFAERTEQHSRHYLDAPVSGGSIKAMQGEISMMASGSPSAFEQAQLILDTISAHVFRLGDSVGAGSKMKLVNQHLAGVHIAAACEALVLASSMEMDLNEVIGVISNCAGTSWMFENRAPHVAAGDYTPHSMVDIFVKDMGIVDQAAQRDQLELPLAQQAKALYEAASQAGMGKMDDSAIALYLAQRNEVDLPGSVA